jgi:hypothetical protein
MAIIPAPASLSSVARGPRQSRVVAEGLSLDADRATIRRHPVLAFSAEGIDAGLARREVFP